MNDTLEAFCLPLNAGMAVPIYTSPSRQEVEALGQMLLQHFIHEQFSDEGLSEENLDEVDNPSQNEFGNIFNQGGYSNLTDSTLEDSIVNMNEVGESIRELANEFSASQERGTIREQANRVDLNHIDREAFFNLLNEIFRNGTDRYRTVAIFFFCSDILIRCVKQGLRSTRNQLFSWAMQFLIEEVCLWVYNHGGWKLMLSSLYKTAFIRTSAFVAISVIIASCSFLWMMKNL